MKILITGGAGFVGSHLCDYFLRKGYKVICVDSLITGKIENIKHNIPNKKFTFINLDITKKFKVTDEIDYILHFASPASPVDYYEYPIETMLSGSLGTYNVVNLALAKKAVCLFASTSEVYGDPQINPQKESYFGNVNSIGPRAVYDEAKRFSEAMIMAYHRKYGLNVRIARIFNTYGPRMRHDDGRVIPNFIMQALFSKPLTVYGKGQQTRSLCFVDDLVRGIEKLMYAKVSTPINLGNPNELTILELAKKIKELTNSKSRIMYRALPQDDPKVRKPDIEKARKLLRWAPKISLDEGLTMTVEWFVNNQVKING